MFYLPPPPSFALAVLGCLLGAPPALALAVTTLFPADDSVNVCPDTPLKLTFNAPPSVGTSGTLKIYTSSGTLVDPIDLAARAANGS